LTRTEQANDHFPEHFRAYIEQLNLHGAEYLLIGGYAMGVYGRLRGTGDLDIYVNPTLENAERMRSATIAYGIPSESVEIGMFMVPRMVGMETRP